jgi:hypothetical protein
LILKPGAAAGVLAVLIPIFQISVYPLEVANCDLKLGWKVKIDGGKCYQEEGRHSKPYLCHTQCPGYAGY